MAKAKKTPNSSYVRLAVSGGVFVSLFFWVPHADAFNVSKQSALTLLAIGLFSNYATKSLTMSRLQPDIVLVGIMIWILALAGSLLTAPSIQLAFWGPSGRLNGFLTYYCLAAMFLVLYWESSARDVKFLLKALTLLGILQTLYNSMQLLERDPITWNNPYGTVIGTLGNSNFTIALTSICFIATSWMAVEYSKGMVRAGLFAILLWQSVIVILSQVRQGLVLIIFGLSFLLFYKIKSKSRLIVTGFFLANFILGIFALLGTLRKGPLASILYKDSITLRGDYWRNAIEMFQNNPVFGVGLSHYGQYFTLYRDETQVTRRGSQFVTDQAHNVPLEFLATGGFLLGITYLFLVLIVVLRSIKFLRSNSGEVGRELFIVFSLWMAYFLQSLISIDQIGLAVWGWILLAFMAALSRRRVQEPARRRGQNRSLGYFTPAVSLSVAVFILSPQWRADTHLKSVYSQPRFQTQVTTADSNLMAAFNHPILASSYLADVAKFELLKGRSEGIDWALKALEKNQDDIEALEYVVVFAMQTGNEELLETYGVRLKSIDPFTQLINE